MACVQSPDVASALCSTLAAPGRSLAQVLGQAVQPRRHAGDLPLAYLLHQPLEPFHSLADVFERVGVRPLVRDMVLDSAREQLTHAVGGTRLIQMLLQKGLPRGPDNSNSLT